MNIFLDCGFYAGTALTQYINAGIVDETWTIYAFEPNPKITVDKSMFPTFKLLKKAVWVEDGKVSFWLSNRHNASHVDDTSYSARDKKIKVPAIDFSKFVSELPEAYIICSMDIEGSEYKVLNKMLQDGTIEKINVLDIEFHDRFMPDQTELDSQALIDKLEAKGIEVRLKVPLR